MRLSDIFVKPLAYTRLFLSAPNTDDVSFRTQIEQQLTEARLAAIDAGYPTGAINQAIFATVAWIDETVMCSSWQGADPWSRQPLQKGYFNTTKGGVEFFDRLDALHGEENAVREVYFLCLALGFEGHYSSADGGGRAALNEIKARELKILRGKDDLLKADSVLFPEAYDTNVAPNPRNRWRISRSTLLLFSIPFGILILLYSVFWLVLKSQVNSFLRLMQ